MLFAIIGKTLLFFDYVSGYMVIIPDYYRGKICDVTKENFDTIMTFLKTESVWEGKLKEDWEKSICPYATKNGATSFGTIGNKQIMLLSFKKLRTLILL